MGAELERVEDERFLTGTGAYTDDVGAVSEVRALTALLFRSPIAHGRLSQLSVEKARALKGVKAILTGQDLVDLGVSPIPSQAKIKSEDGSPLPETPKPLLAVDRVRYAGEPVAAVIAESRAEAEAALAAIEGAFEPLPPYLEPGDQAQPDQLLWDHIPDNRSFVWTIGDEAATEAAFAAAAHTITLPVDQNRIVPNALEPRAALGTYDPQADQFHLTTSSQGAVGLQGRLAGLMGLDKAQLRVSTPDVGGGFGMKIFPYPEQVVVLLASKLTGRPVRWTGSREEAFVADTHGRETRMTGSIALDKDGRILAHRLEGRADLGAYHSTFGPFNPTFFGGRVFGGAYRMPALFARVEGYLTNKPPIDAYRGAGRPEAAYYIERLMDEAGRVTGLGPFEIRRRNALSGEDMPYTNAVGTTIPEGNFRALIDRAEQKLGEAAEGFDERRRTSEAKGLLRGRGVALYLEVAAADKEQATVHLERDGGLTLLVGTQSNGQGHETAFAQLAEKTLGIPRERIAVGQGDTAEIPFGGGTGGSRSLVMSGNALEVAFEALKGRAREEAARRLQARADALQFEPEHGLWRAPESGASLTWAALAADILATEGRDLGPALVATGDFRASGPNFPGGCHVCEVEIDPETGEAQFDRYLAVDDFGALVNPLLVEGQVIGGIAQGIGQVLLEGARYDPQTGLPATTDFATYAVPRAINLPPIAWEPVLNPSETNPLGVKGCGEAGTIGSLSAAANALADALTREGVTTLSLPATPERIWTWLRERQNPVT